MRDPRVYLYRKAGRLVWDAELWLSDGRRRVWRTAETDRQAAYAAAWNRLRETLHAADFASSEPSTAIPAPVQDVDGTQRADPALPLPAASAASPLTPTDPANAGLLARFDRWFFTNLRELFSHRDAV